MSVYESSITNPKKQLEFYKNLSEQLRQEKKQLNERIIYLENSNNRREEIIISLRNEQQLDLYKEVIEEVRKYVGSREMYNDSFEEETNKLLQILDKVKEVK